MSEHFSKTLGGIFEKPGWTPNPAGWDFPKAWVELSTSPPPCRPTKGEQAFNRGGSGVMREKI